jgi:hypothetical protein
MSRTFQRRVPVTASLALAAFCATAAVAAPLGTPTLSAAGATQTSIDITFTAGTGGAPAGFSLQWMTLDAYNANAGWYLSDDPLLCKASFSGVPGYFAGNFNNYTLAAAGDSTQVTVGDLTFDQGASTSCNGPLVCGTTYVFHAFSHAVPKTSWKRSDFSADLSATTVSCTPPPEGCTLTQGYWSTHGAAGKAGGKDELGNYIDHWPVTSLTLGTTTYTEAQLQAIFDKPAGGNGLIALAHQLIAAKLNIADGADPSSIQSSIDAADAMIGSLVVPPIGLGSLAPSATSALVGALDAYNNGVTGPGHCGE